MYESEVIPHCISPVQFL